MNFSFFLAFFALLSVHAGRLDDVRTLSQSSRGHVSLSLSSYTSVAVSTEPTTDAVVDVAS
jgi:hypothetical protein